MHVQGDDRIGRFLRLIGAPSANETARRKCTAILRAVIPADSLKVQVSLHIFGAAPEAAVYQKPTKVSVGVDVVQEHIAVQVLCHTEHVIQTVDALIIQSPCELTAVLSVHSADPLRQFLKLIEGFLVVDVGVHDVLPHVGDGTFDIENGDGASSKLVKHTKGSTDVTGCCGKSEVDSFMACAMIEK